MASGSTQDHRRSRIHELAAVVFPDAEDIEANLVGQDNLIEQIVHALDWGDSQTVAGSEMTAPKLSTPICIL